MAKSDPIERSLDRLGELRRADASETVVQEVREFLRNRSNLVVSKAAKVAPGIADEGAGSRDGVGFQQAHG